MSSPPYTFKSTGTTTRPTRMKPPPEPPLPSPPFANFHTRSRSSSLSSTTSFTSAVSTHNPTNTTTTDNSHPSPPIRFSPTEEATMLATSNTLKAAANKQFTSRDYSSAISTYDKAIAELPVYLEYELAVLQSNIAACYLVMGQWKDAVGSAERGLECLERELPMEKSEKKDTDRKKKSTNGQSNGKHEDPDDDDDDQVIELPEDTTEESTAALLKTLQISDQRKQDITRIRSKLLLRRARSKVMLCDQPPSKPAATTTLDTDDPITTTKSSKSSSPFATKDGESSSHWSDLSTALSDYTVLSTPTYFSILPTSDRKTVLDMLRTLPPRVEAAKKKEVDEMMGKLKELGNGILKPFGLSTDMFKMTQDPNTGGWSMGFDGKSGKG